MVSNSIVKTACICFNRFSVIGHLFRNPNLSSAIQSIITRIIISALIVLPRMPSALLSANPGLMYQVKEKIQKISVSIGCGTSSVMSKSLPFVVEAALEGSNIPVCCNVASRKLISNDVCIRLKKRSEYCYILVYRHSSVPCLMLSHSRSSRQKSLKMKRKCYLPWD